MAEYLLSLEDIQELWPLLSPQEKVESLQFVPRHLAEDFFLSLSAHDQAELLLNVPPIDRRSWVRLLPPDDVADVLQSMDKTHYEDVLPYLDDQTRKEVSALLAYAEDNAGGLMNPRFARLRPEMNLDEAISYLKRQTREQIETIYYTYVLDEQQHLLGVVSFRELFSGKPDLKVKDIMRMDMVKALDTMDQEALSRLFTKYNLLAMPIVDSENRLKGIVTIDDIVDVVNEEATEDIQKLGGMEALDTPYLKTSFFRMIRKRGGWLVVLFLGEMLTASAMGYFEIHIVRAVFLAMFIPLIISSGGNSGSQASTLVIRAMALGEIGFRDWWMVVRREIFVGLTLGSILGAIGFLRVIAWQGLFDSFGPYAMRVGFTIFGSLVGVVTFGTLAGSGLPFLLKKWRLDPASASAPFVATLVDVSGILIYFSLAGILLHDVLFG